MRRTHTVAVAIIAAVVGLASAATPSSAAATTQTVTYSTQELGAVKADFAGFRRVVAATLDDPRGWSLDGRVDFREVRAGGRLTIALASPAAIEGVDACSAFYSCRAGDHVLINSDRWRHATDSYRGQALLHSYRQMVINHEVGHALGFGHVDCSRAGAPAAVMQQQSKGLDGCSRNPWPLRRELAQHAARVGVPAPAVPTPFAVGRRSSHVELGARRSTVRATLGQPRHRFGEDLGNDVYVRPRVTVFYAKNRVVSITTRSRADVGADGLGVGRKPAREVLHRCLGGAERGFCEFAPRGRDGRRTTLILRDGRIAAMRVAVRGAPGTTRSPGAQPSPPPLSVISPLLSAATTSSGAGPCAWWWERAGRCRATIS